MEEGTEEREWNREREKERERPERREKKKKFNGRGWVRGERWMGKVYGRETGRFRKGMQWREGEECVWSWDMRGGEREGVE